MLKRRSVCQAMSGLALLTGALSFSAQGAFAAEIRLLCAAALQPAMDEIIPAFEKSSGHTISVRFANISVNTDSVRRGEAADIVVVSPGQWTDLSKEGKVDAETRVIIARVGLGVFVRKGAPKPDIGTTAAFKSAFLNAGSIAIPRMLNNPVGAYATRLFEKFGVADELERKNVIRNGGFPLRAVAKGDAEIGFTQISEVVAAEGIDFVGPLPADIQNYTTFVAAIPANAKESAAAKAFLGFAASPAATAVLNSKGLEY
jgi:molybdate transport system substrate-binding protein